MIDAIADDVAPSRPWASLHYPGYRLIFSSLYWPLRPSRCAKRKICIKFTSSPARRFSWA
jgi:hypothetical protein